MREIPGYHLEESLYDDGRFLLCRSRRLADNRQVLLKLSKNDTPSPELIAGLNEEFKLLQSLDIPGVIKAIALTTAANPAMMVLENTVGQPIPALIGEKTLPLPDFLGLAAEITNTVSRLHAAGVIHTNLRPDLFLRCNVSGQLTLVDLRHAYLCHRETPPLLPKAPEFTTAALSYLSPEQTGRMNRNIDHRSDLYSLGVLFYQFLTGRLPFTAADPLELIYSHIARRPTPPMEVRPDLPPTVSNIVMKLLEKDGEDRYQSAAGLLADLDRCRRELMATGRITSFLPARADIAQVFRIPKKLYGREQAAETLLRIFARVALGAREMVSISGCSGIGKTALVREIHRPIAVLGGYFITGKFDQLQMNVPYFGWIQAFQGLVNSLLMASEDDLATIKEAILAAVGTSGKVLTDVIFDLELVIGPQPTVPQLSPAGTQFRFNDVFEKFIKAIATRDHALVVFLDDLQWIDPASLKLLKTLGTCSDIEHLLLLTSYRDNEVGPSHPLLATLDNLGKAGTVPLAIALEPLSVDDIGTLLADTLGTDRQQVLPLTRLVFEKTAGNPFFVNQFLAALHAEGLLTFDSTNHTWQWDIARITTKGYTDNVADLMIDKLRRLSLVTQQHLRLAACIGNQFDFPTLALLSGVGDGAIDEAVAEAMHEGLITRQTDTSLAFIHDRVRQAAYSLIARDQRAELHLQIGRLLLARIADIASDPALFDVIGHLNYGAALLVDQEERYRYADINLTAGNKARASTASSSAIDFYSSGIALLAAESWETHHDLTFAISAGLAECHFQMGDPDTAKRLCDSVLAHARTNAERVRMYLLKIDLLTTLGEIGAALESGVECLHLLGVNIPLRPTEAEVRAEAVLFDKLMGSRQIEDLLDLPEATDPDIIAALEILSIMHPPSHFIPDPNLYLLIPTVLCNLSLRYGNAPASAFAYGDYALVLAQRTHSINAFRLGKVACRLVERFNSTIYRSKVYFMMGGVIAPFFEPLAKAQQYLGRCFQAAVEAGDTPFACFARIDILALVFIQGAPLNEVYKEAEICLEFARKVKFEMIVTLALCRKQLILALRGQTQHLGSFDDADFSEAAFEEQIGENIHGQCWYQVSKLLAHFYAGDYQAALLAVNEVKDRLFLIFGEPVSIEYYFFAALTLVACSERATGTEREALSRTLGEYHEKLKNWAENCPETFFHLQALIAAEIARIEGRDAEAMHSYEEAIRSARENGFVQHEALAYELAAYFWLTRGSEDFAGLYLQKAHERYRRWGATGKTRALLARYPQWLTAQPGADAAGEGRQLDLLTVMKAAQAISGEIELDRLVERLLHILIENAGAERGILLLLKDDRWIVEAETSAALPYTKRLCLPLTDYAELPHTVVNLVSRSGQHVLLHDADRDEGYASDPYILSHSLKSVLCLPIVRQQERIGILYLENNLATHAFRPHHLEVMEILCSQVAISLENAILFAKKIETEKELKESEKKYHSLFDRVPAGLFRSTPDGRFLDLNPALVSMLGYPDKDTLLAVDTHTLYAHPEHRKEWQTVVEKNGISRDFETQLQRLDGSAIWVRLSCLAVRDREGTIGFYEGILEDITGRKRAEEEQLRLEEQLRQLQKMETVGLLAGGIAHDFNNLLTPILGYADLLANDTPLEDRARQRLQQIRLAAERARDLIQRLLAFSRKQVIELKTVKLGDLISNAEKMLRRMIRENIAIKIHVASALGHIAADAGQIEQVLLNLSINAQDAMPEGGVLTIEATNVDLDESYTAKHIEITPGAYVMLAISDTGIGIDQKTISHIFDPFFTTKELGKGTGLGLSTVYGIVKQHGGSVCVYSERGHGSVFKVFLPRLADDSVHLEQLRTNQEIAHGTETILLSEDDNMVKQLAAAILESLGYTVLVAKNSDHCIRLLTEQRLPVDLLLTDVVMPGMNGRELFEALRRIDPDLKVLFMSGYTGNVIVNHGVLDHDINFLQKPFSVQALAQKVRKALDGAR